MSLVKTTKYRCAQMKSERIHCRQTHSEVIVNRGSSDRRQLTPGGTRTVRNEGRADTVPLWVDRIDCSLPIELADA